MAKEPNKFSDLSKKRQAALVEHFMDEFEMTPEEAFAECKTLEGEEFLIHLDACENGY